MFRKRRISRDEDISTDICNVEKTSVYDDEEPDVVYVKPVKRGCDLRMIDPETGLPYKKLSDKYCR